MPSINDLLVDEAIRHQVQLAQYSNAVVRKIIAVLNRSDVRLYAALTAALERLDPASFTVERLESLLGSVRAINGQAYSQAGLDLRSELRDFVSYEVPYQQAVIQAATPVQLHTASVSAEQVYAAALARPFQGVILSGVLADMEAKKAKLIRQAVAQGFVEGSTTDQIVRQIRGTRARGYADGITEITRRDAEAVARTALHHMAGFVQDRVTEANADIIKAVQWLSTLDLRTSPICRVRDGKLYGPVSHKPIGHELPWLGGPGRAHWRCRSGQTYVLKSNKELGINLPEVEFKSTRASMDGQVPDGVTYADWIKRQGASRQDEVLGPIRGKLLRDGKLGLEDLYSQNGRYLDLAELRENDAAAFRRAGIDGVTFRQPAGDFGIYDAAYPMRAADVSTPARAAAVKLENQIRRDSRETGAFIAADGTVVVQKTGLPDRVSFTAKELAGTQGTLFTHNHPGNGSFSRVDVMSALASELAELRVAGPSLRYSLQPGDSWPSRIELDSAIREAQGYAQRAVSRMIAAGDLDPRYAQAEAEHQVWVAVARKLGLKYVREKS